MVGKIKAIGHKIKGKFSDSIGNMRETIENRKHYMKLMEKRTKPYLLDDILAPSFLHLEKAEAKFFDRYLEEMIQKWLTHEDYNERFKSFINFWSRTSLLYKKTHKEVFFQIMDEQHYWFLWRSLNQDDQELMLLDTLERYQNDQNYGSMWVNTHSEIKLNNKKIWLEIIERFKNNPAVLKDIWICSGAEEQMAQDDMLPLIMERLEKYPQQMSSVWKCSAPVVKTKHASLLTKTINGLIATLDEYPQNTDIIVDLWKGASPEIQEANTEIFPKIVSIFNDRLFALKNVWKDTSEKVIQEHSDLLPEVFEICKNDPELWVLVWHSISDENQNKHVEVFRKSLEFFKDNSAIVEKLWMGTHLKVINENEDLFQMVANFKEESNLAAFDLSVLSFMWSSADAEEQQKNQTLLPKIIEEVKENPKILSTVWRRTCKELQKENKALFFMIMDTFKNNPDIINHGRQTISDTIRSTDDSLQKEALQTLLDSFSNISGKMLVWSGLSDATKLWYLSKGKTIPELKDSLVKYLGSSDLIKEDGTLLIPENLKQVLSREITEKESEFFARNLPDIIKMWPQVEKMYQYRKANAIINNGLEFRNMSPADVISMMNSFNRPKPTNISAEEFERTNGSEKVGTDTQFTASTSTAVQRAHTLATKMDEAGSMKTFPNFSCESEDGEIKLTCMHPQDKGQILFGYDTHCCFRPNGNADNSAENEWSLLQYCCTTPYGGVLKVESKDGKKVYMGSPVLASGNMLMFHSYETEIDPNNKGFSAEEAHDASSKANAMLIQAAKKAIESSNGTIDVVLMTDLHKR